MDLIERLRDGTPEFEFDVAQNNDAVVSLSVYELAAREIESLRQQLRDQAMQALSDNTQLFQAHDQLVECQAREAKLRSFLHGRHDALLDQFVLGVQDDTVLQEALKQAKREALLEAADVAKYSCNGWDDALMREGALTASIEIRRMAEEL